MDIAGGSDAFLEAPIKAKYFDRMQM